MFEVGKYPALSLRLAVWAAVVTGCAGLAWGSVIQVGAGTDTGEDAGNPPTGVSHGAAPAGWVKWVIPGDAAAVPSTYADFAFPGAGGPGGADTIRLTLSTPVGNLVSPTNSRVAAAPGYPLEGLIQDTLVSEPTGTARAGISLAIDGLPAGTAVNMKVLCNMSNALAETYYLYYGNYQMTVDVNGSAVATTPSPALYTHADPVATANMPADGPGAGTDLFTSFGFTAQAGTNTVLLQNQNTSVWIPFAFNAAVVDAPGLVPEPSCLGLLAALGGMLVRRRRRA